MRWPFVRDRHEALQAGEDFFLLTWDSCRYDSFLKAKTPVLSAITTPRKAYTMATYTLPAHVAFFNGFLPHSFDPEPFYNRYVQQLWRICHRNVKIKPLARLRLVPRHGHRRPRPAQAADCRTR
jgi:hypothetical protein